MSELGSLIHGFPQGNKPKVAASGCEWDPDLGKPAAHDSQHHAHTTACFEVDAGDDGKYRLCNSCAWKAPFKFMARARIGKRRRR